MDARCSWTFMIVCLRRLTDGVQLLARACRREAPRSKRVPVCCNAWLCGRRPHERGSLVRSDRDKERGHEASRKPRGAATRAGETPFGRSGAERLRAGRKKRSAMWPGASARKGGAVKARESRPD